MKLNVFAPFLFVAVLVGLVGLACSVRIGPTPAAQPPQPQPSRQSIPPSPIPQPTQQIELPTAALQPTALPPTLSLPTTAPTSQKFFTEEFNADVTNWSTFLTNGDIAQLDQHVDSGFWVFDLGAKQMYVYSLYEPETYQDVRIDLRAENRGDNTNNISAICRYGKDEGWYEFNIYNSGLYNILYGKWNSAGTAASYTLIADGGSNNIRQGREMNDYTVICKGRSLSLAINGKDVRSISENQFALRSGQIGIGVSSFNRLPVRVDFDWVKISAP